MNTIHRTPTKLLCSLAFLASMLLSACDSGNSLRYSALEGRGWAMGNRVWFLSPANKGLLGVSEAQARVEMLPLGARPVLSRALVQQDSLLLLLQRPNGDVEVARVDEVAGQQPAVQVVELGANFNALVVAPDGRTAIAYLDPESTMTNPGSLNPGEIVILELAGGGLKATRHTLTFRPTAFHFDAQGYFVLVETVDRLLLLELEEPFVDHQIPFSIELGESTTLGLLAVSPAGDQIAAVEKNGRDLFLLGTAVAAQPTIDNVLGLPRVPNSMLFHPDGDRLLIADGSNTLRVLERSDMTLRDRVLSDTVNRLVFGESDFMRYAVAFDKRNNGSKTLFRIDLDTLDVEEWTLAAPAKEVRIHPDGLGLVVVHPDSYLGASWSQDSISLFAFGLRAPSQILLSSPLGDMRFLPEKDGVRELMISLPQDDLLVRYDLATYQATLLPVHHGPERLGLLPVSELGDPTFFVVHEVRGGLVSFLDARALQPPPGGFPAVGGLAYTGLLDQGER